MTKMEVYKGKKRTIGANSCRSVASKPRPRKLNYSHFLKNSLSQSFTLDELIKMIEKEPDDLILHVIKEMKVFLSILEGESVEKNTMGHILRILGKASTSRLQSEVNSMINSLSKCKMFYSVHVSKYLASFHTLRLNDNDSESLEMLTELLIRFHHCMPCTAMETSSVLFPLLENTIKMFLKQNKKLFTLLEKIIEANMKNLEFQQGIKPKEVKYKTAKERLQLQKPPENYRMIPILPTPEDIHKPCVFLRPNLIKGEYEDVEHYLDVQYRLLREDYIKPLRDGISEYLLLKKKKQPFNNLQDATVHNKVQIVKIEFDGDKITHKAYFRDDNFSSINWQQSKRFLYGSLLCFSDNDFQTFYLATVIDRKEISKGNLILEFENPTEDVLNFCRSRRFVVIETSAYFEAYKHNLTVLSLLDEKQLPMQPYIIKVKNHVDVPAYLKDNDCLDVTTLFDNWNEHELFMHSEYKNVNILDDESWPKYSDLNLDNFQFAAIKAALTKEFCIIQGPPGTGKTFIGLKIVRVLLANKQKWHHEKSPLLVICYTNHALDQFLEGLLGFTKSIIRIGGSCSNPEVEDFNIKKLRKEYKDNKIEGLTQRISKLRRKIEDIENSIEKANYHILNENCIRHLIPDNQFWYFSYLKKLYNEERDYMSIWLNFGNQNPKGKIVGRESKNSIKDILDSTTTLSENEAKRIQNLLIIPLKLRWSLYKVWLSKYLVENRAELLHSKAFLQRSQVGLRNMQLARDVYLCREANVIGMTTTGAAKNKDLLNELDPKIVVVEEAAEILESHIVTSLSPGTEHVILIGDHQQLRPNPTVYSLAVNYDMDISLFERMLKNGIKYNRLNFQHRMRPEIASLLVPHFYEDLQNHASVENFENIKGMAKNLFFMSHCHHETIDNSKTKTNLFEAKFIVGLYKYLLLQGYKSSQITILTTYVGQMFTIKKELEDIRMNGNQLKEKYINKEERNISRGEDEENKNDRKDEDVRVTVVDNYQGEENEIILISFVRSNIEGRIGFLKISNRICVALSRAKKGFFGIGNFDILAKESDIWKNIIEKLKDQDAIGPSLQLKCQNHPDTFAAVKDDNDFKSVSDGGCTRDCDFRCKCGHLCPLKCHPYDREHENIICHKPCNKYCIRQHLCPKECYEDCGDCFSMVSKVIDLCGHETEVFCYRKEEQAVCPELCANFFSCLYNKSKIKGVLDNVYFLSCSVSNELMINFMKSFTMYLDLQGYAESEVSLLSLSDPKLVIEEVEVNNKDVILAVFDNYSDTNEFIVASTMTLIALSNVRKGLFCIGDFNLFSEKFYFWKRVIESLKQIGKIGPTLNLQCQNHPEICEVVTIEKDFCSVKGCRKQCEFKLPCGHKCSLLCHIYDMEHKEVKCHLPCMRKCSFNHLCKKKCYEACFCTEIVDKKLELCGHNIKIHCYLQTESLFKTVKCKEIVTIKLPECNHDCDISCWEQSNPLYFFNLCEKPCKTVLACGHVCKGTCGGCKQGRLHVSCKKRCKRDLICGHKCSALCFETCPPCRKPCQEICEHGLCPSLCGQPCNPCMRKCEWKCPHKKCNNLCYKKCDRTPCDKPCAARLKCGHECIGMCGEPCPRVCRTCNKKLMRTVCGGTYLHNSKFVSLENCNHFFEVSELAERILRDSSDYTIRHLKCPRCSKDIFKNFRFGNVIKTAMEGIESVKRITSGDENYNVKLKFNLLKAAQRIKVSPIKKELIKKCLNTGESIQELNVMENFIAILLNFDSIFSDNYEFKGITDLKLFDSKTNLDLCYNLLEYIKKARECMIDFILKNYCHASKEQLKEFAWEAYRVALADNLLRTLSSISKLTYDASQQLNEMMNSLLTIIPFRGEDADKFCSTNETFLALSSTLESRRVKIPALKSVSSCKGTWFNCPKGHVFSSITCLKTSEVKSCYECDPSIAIVPTFNVDSREIKQKSLLSDTMNRFHNHKNPSNPRRPKYTGYSEKPWKSRFFK